MNCTLFFICILIGCALHVFISITYDEIDLITPKTLKGRFNYTKGKAWTVFFMIFIFAPFVIIGRLCGYLLTKLSDEIKRREQLKELSPEEERFIDELMREMEESQDNER